MAFPLTDADIDALFAAVISPAETLGVFEFVNGHEPKNAGSRGVVCSYWLDTYLPIPTKSGADRTAMGLVFQARIQTDAMQEPADGIDPAMLRATSALVNAYHGNFDLGVNGTELDLLGSWFPGGLGARAGYIDLGQTKYRAMILSIPITIFDAYPQVR